MSMSHDPVLGVEELLATLRESEERFRTIFESAPVGISLLDRDGRYLSVNPVRQQMLGYSEAELIGRHYLEVTHPDDVPLDQAVNEEARLLQTDRYQLEKRFLRRSGETTWARITIAIVRDSAGEHAYSVSIAEDITAQRAADEERNRLLRREREARNRLEQVAAERDAILRQIGEGIIIADPAGRIVFVNRAAEEIHGLPRNPAGRLYVERYLALDVDREPIRPGRSPLSRAAIHGETLTNVEWIVVRHDGSEVVAEGSAIPVVLDDGTRLGAVLTIRDVTAQRRLEQEKDDFLSAAAHDLRTPLTTIKGHAQILRRRLSHQQPVDVDALSRGLERLEAGATRLSALINDLLDVANIQIGGGTTLARSAVDLVLVTRRVADDQGVASERHEIHVESNRPEIIGFWDPVRIDRVLSNLMSNALKYSPEGGIVRVILTRDDGHAIIRVSDNGIGIPAADLPYIFDRFRRAENVAGRIAGTGIGLAAVQRIVRQHGGTIEVESEEGQGSTFIVTLPVDGP